jgi:hypothetical protein
VVCRVGLIWGFTEVSGFVCCRVLFIFSVAEGCVVVGCMIGLLWGVT